MVEVQTAMVPLLDMSCMATEADARGKAEFEWWFEDVPAEIREEALKRVGDGKYLAVEVHHDHSRYGLEWRSVCKYGSDERKLVVMFRCYMRSYGRDSVRSRSIAIVVWPRASGATPITEVYGLGEGA